MTTGQYKTTPNFTGADVENMLSVVHHLTTETSRLYNAYNNEPTANSIATNEKTSFPKRESVENAHYGGILSIEAAADHLMAFADTLAEPAKTVAPWTCVRGLLESCALACWFLNPIIDVKTRVGRYFAFRYIGFVQQIKLLNVDGNRQEDVNKVEQRIQKVEQDALKLGFPRILNKAGKIDGIGQKMPDITQLIGLTLNREAEYRLLSAIAHGHHWATHKIGFRVIKFIDSRGKIQKGLEKHIEPTFVLYAANIAVTSFAQALWDIWRLYGWNEEEIKLLLDTTFDRLKYTNERRIWENT
jgi:hypothetical protein